MALHKGSRSQAAFASSIVHAAASTQFAFKASSKASSVESPQRLTYSLDSSTGKTLQVLPV
eukprot:CAMPEP_0174386082 /NCGR_PEP_ID=MMETSP0811_2-20130205/127036_1 /TAXON_ID=73025 ORGANISM="Eutreptiella gymnastica-like, Strain CCMP1594" /NCGR_SAMPLE_ID=MMETSP0811_2 /ASSEMBLY_ACC=CAM_ASM_000667 /LENGTH=60 /DNA_ID=CAMNT_0015540627 /DNA_START=1288 /DNA_END=1470 /DNA_ORIENTATION=+